MAIRVAVRGDVLDVEIRGLFDSAMCMSGDQHIPLGDILSARVASWDEVRASLGWRVAGAYWPGLMATGWYAVPDRRGARQFVAVFRDCDGSGHVQGMSRDICKALGPSAWPDVEEASGDPGGDVGGPDPS